MEDPVLTAITRPDVPIVATAVFVLTHVPPGLASESRLVVPEHNEVTPVIEETLLTVTGLLILQPVDGSVNVIVAEPEATPVTTPVPEPTEATEVLLDDQVVNPETSLRVIVCPAQTVDGPVIPDGKALIVIGVVVKQPVLKV